LSQICEALYPAALAQSSPQCGGQSSQSVSLVCVRGLFLFDLVVTAKRQEEKQSQREKEKYSRKGKPHKMAAHTLRVL
jgi:hypothetical protein